MFNIPGLILTGSAPVEAPLVAVIAREKSGKSVLATTLVDWPKPGDLPLVLAMDPTGPESCAKLGYQIPYLRWKDEPGATWREKLFSLLNKVELCFRGNGPKPSSLLIDCTSTMTERLYEEAQRIMQTKDNRQRFGYVKDASTAFFYRIHDLGIPTAWIAWLKEMETITEHGNKRIVPGGVQAVGSFRETLSGKAQQVVLLEKLQGMPGDPNASSDGAIRRFRTRDFAGIRCEGRFPLPDPMPANLARLFHYIMQRGVQPQQG
jgi:hypothetical protein